MTDINCNSCNLIFNKESEYYSHYLTVHKSNSTSIKKILILGGGFGGITVLQKIEKKFKNEPIEITIISDDNFFLFTPMLPQVVSGLLHPSHITTPIRCFCKKTKFLHASIDSVDLEQQLVTIQRSFDNKLRTLEYDILIVALGGETHYFGNDNLKKYSFAMKNIEDAIAIKNHIVLMLEHAAQTGNYDLQKTLLTFVVVGSGLAGVETVSEINHFVKQSISKFYPSINPKNTNVILISSKDRILPEINEGLAKKALNYLEKNSIRVLKNTRVCDAGEEFVILNDGKKLQCSTLIWTGGITMNKMISELNCEHGVGGRILVDEMLRMKNHDNVFVLGDCALIQDASSDTFYPSTAQHAIREGNLIADNLVLSLSCKELKQFSFHSLGIMAIIGNRFGIATLAGHDISGIYAWLIWRAYYLSKIPTLGKKLKISIDWAFDLFLSRDITLMNTIKKKMINSIRITNNVPSIKEQLVS